MFTVYCKELASPLFGFPLYYRIKQVMRILQYVQHINTVTINIYNYIYTTINTVYKYIIQWLSSKFYIVSKNVFLPHFWLRTDRMRAVGLWKYPSKVLCQQSKATLLRYPSLVYSGLCPETSGGVFWSLRDVWAHRRNCWSSVLLKCIRTMQPACIVSPRTCVFLSL